jgi:hypothetical protein
VPPIYFFAQDLLDLAAQARRGRVIAGLFRLPERLDPRHELLVVERRIGRGRGGEALGLDDTVVDPAIETARRMLDQQPLREVAAILGPRQALDTEANVLRLPSN